ncbi:hypothetical protein Tco_0753629 [Tanacetum coccineum]
MPTNIKLYDGTTDPEDHLSRFSSAANSGEWPMSVWCRMFQQTLDGSARGWFENLSGGSIGGWTELRQQFTTKFSTRRACFKDPTEITKIVRKANETLVAFKERWIMETGFITRVPEVMKISSFMDAHKCQELAKQCSDNVPKTVDEMMTRLDDFVRLKEAFASTELPKGEASEASRKSTTPVSRKEDRFHKGGYGADRRRNEGRCTFNNRDGLVPYRAQTPYQAPRDQGFHHPRFNLNSLTKLPKEILASEPQLNLQPPRPKQLPPKKENQDKYCDYHGGKGHYTNDCFQLKRQLEMALESGNLNNLIKDVRQRGWGNTKGRDAGKDKGPRRSGSVGVGDVRTLLRELKSRYKVASKEHPDGFGGFAGGVVKPIGKIELEVVFGDEDLFRTVMINFTVVRAPSPYNVIFGRTGLRSL